LALHIAIGQSAPEVDDFSALVRLPPSEPRWLPSGAIAGVIRPPVPVEAPSRRRVPDQYGNPACAGCIVRGNLTACHKGLGGRAA
jgi:hypothetical protein